MSKTITIFFMMLVLTSSSQNLRLLQTTSLSGFITSVSTGKVIMDTGGNLLGSAVEIVGKSGASNATWVLTEVASDSTGPYYTIQNADTGHCLRDAEFYFPGATVATNNCVQDFTAYWYLIPAGNAFDIMNQASQWCLQIDDNGLMVDVNVCDPTAASQQWTIGN